ncbi:MAG: hypothetical protein EAZ53_03035 [Bacteroidetes bacterium]|nr:MAG: hypothetical protein EAZ53_03035 [Bacteroidota bacterium]
MIIFLLFLQYLALIQLRQSTQIESITVNLRPNAPTGTNPNPTCVGSVNVILTALGSNLKWYNTSIGGFSDASLANLSTNNSGIFTKYVSQTVNNCESIDRLNIVAQIIAAPVLPTGLTYGVSQVCADRTSNLLLNNANLTTGFSTTTTGFSVNSNGSIVFPTTFIGNATVLYTTSVVGCNPVSTLIGISINKPITLSGISYSQSQFCKQGTQLVSINGENTGIFYSSNGLSLNANNGEINLANSSKGSYQVIYTIAGNGACAGKSAQTNLEILEPSAITISAANFTNEGICEQNEAKILLSTIKLIGTVKQKPTQAGQFMIILVLLIHNLLLLNFLKQLNFKPLVF